MKQSMQETDRVRWWQFPALLTLYPHLVVLAALSIFLFALVGLLVRALSQPIPDPALRLPEVEAQTQTFLQALGYTETRASVCHEVPTSLFEPNTWQCVVRVHPEQPPLVLRCTTQACRMW